MNIGSVTRDNTLQALQSITATGDSDATSATGSTTASEDATQVQLSKPGELFKKLAELQQTDPAKFKETVQKIADSLKTEAQGADAPDSQRLNKLADAFSQAAQSGDMSSLKPAHQGHHGHHGGAAGGGVGAGVQRAYSAADQGSSPEPSTTMQSAFASALSIVDDALSGTSSSTATTTSALAGVSAA